ncbi:MAG: amidohydrolase family protein [Clostridia bacterium]|nr:amidohydrolase family protein [Clostridia bacterium]
MERTLISGGLIVDGSGKTPARADLLIEDGRIAGIAPSIQAEGATLVQAAGKVVTPGFIDIHRHCDIAALIDPQFGIAELAQGITTVVGGNCGLSIVPTPEPYAEQIQAYVAPCLGPARGLRFADGEAYMRALAQKPPRVNMGMLVGLGAVRAAVKGYARKPFAHSELQRAKEMIACALEAGMLGLSVGVMYAPECYNTDEEYISLISAAAPYGRPVCCHIRGEGDGLVPSVREVIHWGERAGVPVHISHLKCTGIRNWGRGIGEAIEEIERARAGGLDVTCDVYPYDAGATTLVSLLPPCVLEDDGERLWDKLGTRQGVEQVRLALGKPQPGWDNMAESIGWDRITVSSAALAGGERLAGKSLEAICNERNLSDPVEALCRLLAESRGNAQIVVHSMSRDDVDAVARLPYACLISDALYSQGPSHPRRYGAFARVIRDLVVERGVIGLPEAVRKMTALPAQRLGMADAGLLAPGKRADICVFDPALVRDHATYEEPQRLSTGMEAVFIGGKAAWLGERPRAAGTARVVHA